MTASSDLSAELNASVDEAKWDQAWQNLDHGRRLHISEIKNLEDMKVVAEKIQKRLPEKCVVLLSGEVGSGKTTFVQFCIGFLARENLPEGLEDLDVQSPSFALHNAYDEVQVDHWDLYRIDGAEDLESSGFWDQFAQDRRMIFIEWPEKLVEADLPRNWPCLKICFAKMQTVVPAGDDESRSLQLLVLGKTPAAFATGLRRS